MPTKPTRALTSHQRADQLVQNEGIVRIPTAVTFLITGSESHQVTIYPETRESTCRCRYGAHHPFMPRGEECYHAKAGWKLVDRDGA